MACWVFFCESNSKGSYFVCRWREQLIYIELVQGVWCSWLQNNHESSLIPDFLHWIVLTLQDKGEESKWLAECQWFGLRASGSLDLQGTSADRFSSRIEITQLERIARPLEFILSAAFPAAGLSSAAGEVLSASPLVYFSDSVSRKRPVQRWGLFLEKA
jgi:hypothetical protein